MMHAPHSPLPVRLWLAAAPPQGGDEHADEQGDADLQPRSLRVLIVEDEFFISLDTKALLTALGHTVVAIAVSADQAVSFAATKVPDVVLMDIRLDGARDGIDAAEEIRSRFGIPSLFITANTDPQMRRRAEVTQPLGFLEKPLTRERLRVGLARIRAKQ